MRSTYWIFSPLKDTTFILLTPLAILIAFAAARAVGWMDALLAFGLALAMAHYFPGILRAYGDRALFRRFKVRLIIAPLFIVAVTTCFAYRALHGILLLAQIWGMWHWMMQAYGFARIYDAKAEPAARTPAKLDQTICLLWFGTSVFVLNFGLAPYVTSFYQSGGSRIPTEILTSFTRGWLAVTIVATLFYAVQIFRTVRKGGRPNPLKFVFIVLTFAYLTYTVSTLERPLLGFVMFESWHDIQYLAIVWLFNLNRAQKNPEAGPFIRFLFRPRAVLVLAYVGVCLAFGSLTHAWSLFENETVVRIVASVVTSSALLHYYMDGFIWKIREEETRQSLDVGSMDAVQRLSDAPLGLFPGWARHAALWFLFAVPAGLLFVGESQGNVTSAVGIYENIVDAFPNSANAHYELARELQDGGRLREASVHFERALELAPDLLQGHIFLGILRGDQRELAAAKVHLERALALDPRNAEVHNNLGIILDELGDPQTAKAHLERAIQIQPEYALAHNNLGTVLTKLGDHEQAKIHHQHAVSLDPSFAEQNLP